ncbi:uncharacterized protein LOC119837227 [Zerene cesonia]|uniref:uncharacterized protein LOC119837227 n=1 Tax=Zerene cesonia TaxID=33412 RepID=UPI0018E4F56A|nr:uncharacterized protein LOC119837227 [Zerene cesonia]
MNSEKLSGEEVPYKFSEWLLEMGCPAEKVPSIEKISQMCRGQYYMVWRSLIEHVQSKQIIRQRRLQVFINDLTKCKKRSPFNERNQGVVEPLELTLWNQQVDVRKKLNDAEARVKQAHSDLKNLLDKITSKVAERNLSQQKVKDLQRRAWLLQQIYEDLECKKKNLNETKHIADSICFIGGEDEVQNKLEKCMSLLKRSSPSQLGSNTSVMSAHESDSEETIASLVKCRGDALWAQLYEKRAALVSQLTTINTKHEGNTLKNKNTPQSVLTYTAALHSSLALESVKNQLLIKQARAKLTASVEMLDNCLAGEACELLVLRCERARSEARVNTLRALLDDLTSRSGAFRAHGDDTTDDSRTTVRRIGILDKDIEDTRDEIKRMKESLIMTERKINNVKECLLAVFNGFHCDGALEDRFKGVQLDFPQESISTLRKFYTERCDKARNKTNLSMSLDVSETSFVDENNPKFTDELRVYLKKFNLEKNRKIVLESGDKIWIFETLQSCLSRLQEVWLERDLTPVICPSSNLNHNVFMMFSYVQQKDQLSGILQALSTGGICNVDIDITDKTEAEEKNIDKIKKQIAENMAVLQRTKKNLEIGQGNLEFWSDNVMKTYVSPNRTINGKSFRDYEAFYIEAVNLHA